MYDMSDASKIGKFPNNCLKKENSTDENEDTRNNTYLDDLVPTGRDDDRVGNVGAKADARNPKSYF
jgi:hypothetical protein